MPLSTDVDEAHVPADRDHHGQQLEELGDPDAPGAALAALRELLSQERPWRTLVEAEAHAATLRAAYVERRTRATG